MVISTILLYFLVVILHSVSAALKFQCSRPADSGTSDYHRLIWCPYVPDSTESTGSASPTEDGSVLMMVTHDSIVSLLFFVSFCFIVDVLPKTF